LKSSQLVTLLFILSAWVILATIITGCSEPTEYEKYSIEVRANGWGDTLYVLIVQRNPETLYAPVYDKEISTYRPGYKSILRTKDAERRDTAFFYCNFSRVPLTSEYVFRNITEALTLKNWYEKTQKDVIKNEYKTIRAIEGSYDNSRK